MTQVRPAGPDDAEVRRAFLDSHHSLRVARLGQLLDAMEHPALVATNEDGDVLGMVTLRIEEHACEILTLHVRDQWRGTGTQLLAAASRAAIQAGCRRLFLITTNDNTEALRFYQRRGFRLAALHPGRVEDSRKRLKPEIPEFGNHGIPIRDELVLEQEL